MRTEGIVLQFLRNMATGCIFMAVRKLFVLCWVVVNIFIPRPPVLQPEGMHGYITTHKCTYITWENTLENKR